MSDPTFTILLPVHRSPAMLPYAIESVLAQERQDFELFVICDGTPQETVSCAQDFAARDNRIRLFVHSKGERHGEAYRDDALQNAHSTYVCQIGDDDLWFPTHLTEMAALLRTVDFGNLSHVEVRADGRVVSLSGDVGEAAVRQRMLQENFNFFGPTVAGYRLSAYRSLPVGWRPAPPELPTDLYMWRKFFAQEHLRFGTRMAVTTVKFAAHVRRNWSMDQRAAEVKEWAARVADPADRDAIVQMAMGEMSRRSYAMQVGHPALHAQIRSLRDQVEELRALAAGTRSENASLHAQLEARTQQVLKLRQRIKLLKQTWSWRLAKPFRKAARLLGR